MLKPMLIPSLFIISLTTAFLCSDYLWPKNQLGRTRTILATLSGSLAALSLVLLFLGAK